jgi:amino acid adenylation domain-containing protein/thioester reductase-like protein
MANSSTSDITPGQVIAPPLGGGGFTVTANSEGQHAIWPAELALPDGWSRQSDVLSGPAGQAAIAALWPDITPARIRAGRLDPDDPGESGRDMPSQGGGARPCRGPSVPGLFGTRAARQPHATAVEAGDERLTYRELDESANQLAHRLRDMGAGPETLVGVCHARGIAAIRCLLAVLKSGGAYLPLDPSLPAARLTQMCGDARPAIIMVSAADAGAFPGTGARLLLTGELNAVPPGRATAVPQAHAGADNIAYVIHTSGSTGRPKAVAVSHGALACTIQELSRQYQISARDRVLQLASLGFDTSVEQILVTLLSGATLMLPPPGTVAPTDLLRYLAEEHVTVADLTPVYWHQLLAITQPGDERLRSIRLMITGGETAVPADCAAAMAAAPGAMLLNAYGLTEVAITSTLFQVPRDPDTWAPSGRVPVGRPLPHTQVLVLSEALAPVPEGVAGEIYIGGCGVARGYLGRPDLTAERFLPNPYAAVPGSRMYRTGDIGRWRADQCLEVIGRADRQVKVRGFRIEPAEIENALARHPGVAEAAVLAYGDPAHRQLAAYYTRRHGGGHGDAAGPEQDLHSGECLRGFLAARIPGFMVPGLFIEVGRLPRAPDGTVDRQALPAPAIGASGNTGHGYSPLQAGLSHLWSRILQTGPVGLDDDFFLRGGDSLRAAEMLANVRVMFGISPGHIRPLTRCLLRQPTLRSFAQATHDARAGTLAEGHADHHIDVAREAELDHAIQRRAGPPPRWREPREVLLTGATGFLGIHLLRELLQSTTARVHCLVRAPNAARALRRLTRTAGRYALGDMDLRRVVPLPGDLAKPDLGLPPGTFGELAESADVIYHAGAVVNFIYPYEELRATNVAGTRELIRLAGRCRGIPVHFISSTAVLAGFGAMDVREVTEDTPLAYADQLRMGYLETKFVAEELLRNAARAGLPVAIYRPLDITGDDRTGAWNTATEMYAMVRFITDAGVAPDIDLPLDFVPADVCASAITHISTHSAAAGHTYHLASSRRAPLGSLVDRLRARGFSIREIPYEEWIDELLKYAADHPGHPMTAFVPLFVDRDEETGLTVAEMYLGHIFPSYTRSRTEHALRDSGIAFPAVGDRLLDLTIDRLIATGNLRDPGATTMLPLPRPATDGGPGP